MVVYYIIKILFLQLSTHHPYLSKLLNFINIINPFRRITSVQYFHFSP